MSGSACDEGGSRLGPRRRKRSRPRIRTRAVLLVAILTLGALATLAAPAPVTAQGAENAPWFGPADRLKPAEGWTFRVPVTITNDEDHALRDHVVAVELNILDLLIDAGWLNETSGGSILPRSFTLDTDSIRVVEYERGFADYKKQEPRVTPHVFYPSLFTESLNGRQFDEERTPVATLAWRMNGVTAADNVRFYMVYFKTREYGDAPTTWPNQRGASDLELESAAAESYASAGPGQVFYFRTNGQARANRMDLVALHDETNVVFMKTENNKFVVFRPDGLPEPEEPGELHLEMSAMGSRSISLPGNTIMKVFADKPVLLADRGKVDQPRSGGGPTYGGGGFAMALRNSASGDYGATFAGTEFFLPGYAQIWIMSTRSGTTNVHVLESGVESTCRLTASQPACLQGRPPGGTGNVGFVSVTSDKPVLVQYAGPLGQLHQAPALSGAPVGTQFSTALRRDDAFTMSAMESASVRVFDPLKAQDQIHPFGPFTSTPPGPLEPGCMNRVDLEHNASFPQNNPFTTVSVTASGERSGQLAVVQGGPVGSSAGFFTGHGASRMTATGPVAIAGHFNETGVEVVKCTPAGVSTESFSVSGDYVDLRYAQEPSTTWYEITTTKPVTVMSTTPLDTYARFVPGRVLNPDVDVGALEFRGHLVDVRSTDRDFKTTGPDVPVNFSLLTLNLGRWLGGANLPDTVRITCESDVPEWEITGCDQSVRLDSFESERFSVSVTPRNARPDDRGVITVRAQSEGTPTMVAEATLRVVVEVTYGVGTWFDYEGGPKTIDPPISLDPGESHDYQVIVKNRGSVRDVIDLERIWVADSGQWLGKLTLKGDEDGDEIDRLTLDPGEVATLTLRVTAPVDPLINVPPDLIVKATSTDRAQTDKVTSLTRIRADIRFSVQVDARTKLAAPEEPVNFTLSLLNSGTDLISVSLRLEGLLPDGWSARIVDEDDANKSSFSLTPNVAETVNLTVVPPAGERAGSLTTVRIAAETTAGEETRRTEESATVVVKHEHIVDVAPFPETTTLPGDRADLVLDLTNLGNGDEAIEALPQTMDPLWTLDTPEGAVVRVARDDSARLPIGITVPEAEPAGLYNVNFTLRLSREAETNVTIPIRVPEVPRIAFDAPDEMRVTPGQAWSFPMDVRNSGNVPGVATLDADVPAGWGARFDPPTVDLAPGKGTRVTFIVNATSQADDGRVPVTFTASFDEDEPASEQDSTVTVGRPSLYVNDAATETSPRRGESFIVTARVGNRGDMEAKDVRVVLLVNGKEVDAVTLGRVRTGEEQLAVLNWEVDERVRDVQVVLNPDKDQAFIDASPDEGKIASVTFAQPFLGVPGPGVLVVLFAAAAGWLLPRVRSAAVPATARHRPADHPTEHEESPGGNPR